MNLQASLGFLMDERRLNVAITRPEHFLVIFGNASTLQKSNVWNSLINHFKENDSFISTLNTSEDVAKEPGLMRGLLNQLEV